MEISSPFPAAGVTGGIRFFRAFLASASVTVPLWSASMEALGNFAWNNLIQWRMRILNESSREHHMYLSGIWMHINIRKAYARLILDHSLMDVVQSECLEAACIERKWLPWYWQASLFLFISRILHALKPTKWQRDHSAPRKGSGWHGGGIVRSMWKNCDNCFPSIPYTKEN